VSYFTLRIIIILMETIKYLYVGATLLYELETDFDEFSA
jgi:hypothetical protein